MAKYKTSEHVVSFGSVEGTDIEVGTAEWFQWLETVSSFRYEDGNGDFAVQKRSGKYWNAVKRKIGDRRQKYLGKTSDLTANTLKEASFRLNTSDITYYKLKEETRSEKRKQKCNTKEDCITIREISNCDTIDYCTTDSPEESRSCDISVFLQQIDELSLALAEVKNENWLLKEQNRIFQEKRQKAIVILNESLPLPANKGGAIKQKVRDALACLQTD